LRLASGLTTSGLGVKVSRGNQTFGHGTLE
jgi:hypothetical protein